MGTQYITQYSTQYSTQYNTVQGVNMNLDARYGIPKGTLYDNILGKSKRMQVLDQVGLTDTQEVSVLEFCCEISSMPYNRYSSELPCNEC